MYLVIIAFSSFITHIKGYYMKIKYCEFLRNYDVQKQ